MKAKILVTVFILCLLGMFYKKASMSSSLSPPPSRTGAPGENSCANSCHTGNLNTGPGMITFSLEGIMYQTDSTYDINLSVIDTTKSRFGFQLTALDANNQMVGSFIQGQGTSIQSGMSRQYISHRNANNLNSWQFQWMAPKKSAGLVTFYLAANAANNNSSNSGDNIYTSSYVIEAQTPLLASLNTNKENNINVFPNPSKTFYNVSFSVISPTTISLSMLDVRGNLIQNLIYKEMIERDEIRQFKVPQSILPGIQILKFQSENEVTLKKILII